MRRCSLLLQGAPSVVLVYPSLNPDRSPWSHQVGELQGLKQPVSEEKLQLGFEMRSELWPYQSARQVIVGFGVRSACSSRKMARY